MRRSVSIIVDQMPILKYQDEQALRILAELVEDAAARKERTSRTGGATTLRFDEIAEALTAISARVDGIDTRVQLIAGVVGETTQQFDAQQLKGIAARIDEIAGRLDAISALIDVGDNTATSLLNRSSEAQLWLEKISAESQNAFAHIDGATGGTRGDLAGLANQVAEVRLWLEKISSETHNTVIHLDGRMVTSFNTLFNERLPQIIKESHASTALALEGLAHNVDRSRWCASPREHYRPAKVKAFDRILLAMEKDFPAVSLAWRERLNATMKAFSVTKSGNAANVGDLYSRLFKSFTEIHISGRALDVGCGVFGRPYYLSEYPGELISGIEPLEMVEPADFECVRGVSEYLPWPDGSFSTVLNATALDHSASLTTSLNEMARVLCRDGVLLLWIASERGSPEFKPEDPDFSPADEYHLFHFDVAWFEPLIAKQWHIVDRMEFPTPTFDHVFYALRPIRPVPVTK